MRLAFWKKKPSPPPPVVQQQRSDDSRTERWKRLEALAPTIRHASLVERQAFMLELYDLILTPRGGKNEH